MHRTTVMLPPELKARAMKRADEKGVSLGELIREALSTLLDRDGDGHETDPLYDDTTVHPGPSPSDLVDRHDDYLYGS
jgi:hypothetical protein